MYDGLVILRVQNMKTNMILEDYNVTVLFLTVPNGILINNISIYYRGKVLTPGNIVDHKFPRNFCYFDEQI